MPFLEPGERASTHNERQRKGGVNFAQLGFGVSANALPTNILDVTGSQNKGVAPCVLCGGSVGSHSCISCAGVFCASCCFSGTKSYDDTR